MKAILQLEKGAKKMSDSIRSRIVGSYREDEKYREGHILYQPLMNL